MPKLLTKCLILLCFLTPLINKVHSFIIRVNKSPSYIAYKYRNVVMRKEKDCIRQILSANLKEQRRILGVSQEKLAELAGLSWQAVNSIECQRTWVSDKTLKALASVFKIETYQLLLPPATQTALSSKSADTIQKLAKAKKAYDEKVNEIMNTPAKK